MFMLIYCIRSVIAFSISPGNENTVLESVFSLKIFALEMVS